MKVALVGAYGYTGKLICELFAEKQIAISIYGRDLTKLKSLKSIYPNILESKGLNVRESNDALTVIHENDIIINCAGPFTEEAPALLQYAVDLGKTYLDITGELSFVKDSFEVNNEKAKQNGAVIIHGCAFESAVVDLVLSQIHQESPIREFRSIYYFKQHKVSPGTRMTMKLSKYRPNWSVHNGNWKLVEFENSKVESDHIRWDKSVGIPYPLPEVAFAKWNYNVSESISLLAVEKTEALFLGSKELDTGNSIETLDKIRQRKKEGPNKAEREAQECEILLQINFNEDNGQNYLISSTDMYQITANIIALATESILSGHRPEPGIISPSKTFVNPRETLDKLGVTYTIKTS